MSSRNATPFPFYGEDPVNVTQPTSSDEPTAVTACCGEIKDLDRYPGAEHRGRRVFQSDLDRFMSGEIPHPVDED